MMELTCPNCTETMTLTQSSNLDFNWFQEINYIDKIKEMMRLQQSKNLFRRGKMKLGTDFNLKPLRIPFLTTCQKCGLIFPGEDELFNQELDSHGYLEPAMLRNIFSPGLENRTHQDMRRFAELIKYLQIDSQLQAHTYLKFAGYFRVHESSTGHDKMHYNQALEYLLRSQMRGSDNRYIDENLTNYLIGELCRRIGYFDDCIDVLQRVDDHFLSSVIERISMKALDNDDSHEDLRYEELVQYF